MDQDTSSRPYKLQYLFGLAQTIGVDETRIEQVRDWHHFWAAVVLTPTYMEASDPTTE